jgi:hypothetical protein
MALVGGTMSLAASVQAAAVPLRFEPTEPHIVCDNPAQPDYPSLKIRPGHCFLGLGASPYDSQPVPGHRYPLAIALRKLHWHHWGRRLAVAQGRVCLYFSVSGHRECERARVQVFSPRKILPAGGASIYQRILVHHLRHSPRYRPFVDWYQPGLDY